MPLPIGLIYDAAGHVILDPATAIHQYKVSIRVTCNALTMLAANRYVSRPGPFRSYSVIWQAGA